jgi:hypothetical protein
MTVTGKILQNGVAREILGRDPGPAADEEACRHYGAAFEDGRPYKIDEFPLSRAIRTGEAVEREPCTIVGPTAA